MVISNIIKPPGGKPFRGGGAGDPAARIIAVIDVHQAFQFKDIRQSPIAGDRAVRQSAGAIGKVFGPVEGTVPGDAPVTVGVPQPDQAGEVVGQGAVVVVREPRLRPGHAGADIAVLAGAGAVDQGTGGIVAGGLAGLRQVDHGRKRFRREQAAEDHCHHGNDEGTRCLFHAQPLMF